MSDFLSQEESEEYLRWLETGDKKLETTSSIMSENERLRDALKRAAEVICSEMCSVSTDTETAWHHEACQEARNALARSGA